MISPSGRTRHRKPMPHWLMMHPRAVARQISESLRDFMSINQAHSGPRFSRQDDGARTSGGHFAGSDYHVPVLAEEVIAALQPAPGKLILDGTLGGGGHSELMLRAGANVIGIDRDPEALEFATARLAPWGDRFVALRGNFADWPEMLEGAGVGRCLHGILLDVGVSSRQLDKPERGFSFVHSGPLDMRMDPDQSLTAEEVVNTWSAEDIARAIYYYGEEKASRRIAAAIVKRREQRAILTTKDLATIVESVVPRSGRTHPATKTFQGIRIAVNGELENLEEALQAAHQWLLPGGILAVITFHSLEDRLVKQFFRTHSEPLIDSPEWPAPKPNPSCWYVLPERKGYAASGEELSSNPRSRSARLRVAVRRPVPTA